jgi:hypothetical protein
MQLEKDELEDYLENRLNADLRAIVPEMPDEELFDFIAEGSEEDIDCMLKFFEDAEDYISCARIKKVKSK